MNCLKSYKIVVHFLFCFQFFNQNLILIFAQIKKGLIRKSSDWYGLMEKKSLSKTRLKDCKKLCGW